MGIHSPSVTIQFSVVAPKPYPLILRTDPLGLASVNIGLEQDSYVNKMLQDRVSDILLCSTNSHNCLFKNITTLAQVT